MEYSLNCIKNFKSFKILSLSKPKFKSSKYFKMLDLRYLLMNKKNVVNTPVKLSCVYVHGKVEV